MRFNTLSLLYVLLAASTSLAADTNSPKVSFTDLSVKGDTVTVSFTSQDDVGIATQECQLDKEGYKKCTSPVRYSGLTEGLHKIRLRVSDKAGNYKSNSREFTISAKSKPTPSPSPDQSPSVKDTKSPSVGFKELLVNGNTLTVSFTAKDDVGIATQECQIDKTGYSDCKSPATFSGLSKGTHKIRLRVSDKAGNYKSTSREFTISSSSKPAPNPTPAPAPAPAPPPDRAPSSSSKVTWLGDFETGDLSQYREHLYKGGTVDVVKSPVRAGKYAARMTIASLTPEERSSSMRAELLSNSKSFKIPWDTGEDVWMGFSIYLTEDIRDVYTLFQIHSPVEPKGAECDFEGNSILMQPQMSTGRLAIKAIINGGRSEAKGAGSNTTTVWSEPLRLNRWIDFVYRLRLSTKGEGLLQIWRDGQKVYEKFNITSVNPIDSCGRIIPAEKQHSKGPYVGIYGNGPRNGENSVFRRIYYDEVRVGHGNHFKYSDVAPK